MKLEERARTSRRARRPALHRQTTKLSDSPSTYVISNRFLSARTMEGSDR
jgi:hypothetical protein